MLHEIHIQNYAVIDTLKVEFSPGLNLLSGETGSENLSWWMLWAWRWGEGLRRR